MTVPDADTLGRWIRRNMSDAEKANLERIQGKAPVVVVPRQPATNGNGASASASDDEDDPLARMRNGTYLDEQEFQPLREFVPGVFVEGSTMIVAPPKIGKSNIMLDVSLAIAAGGKAFGVLDVGDARPVLLMALEDGERRLKAKAKVLYGDRPLPELFHYLTHIEPGRVMETVRAFTALHVDNPPLIVLDTLGKAMPVALPGESAYQRDYRVGSGLKRCVDALPGSALVIVHHDRKAGSDDFVDSVSGTHGLAGACDTVIVINRPRHEDKGVLKITGRDIAEAEYAVKVLDGIRWQLDGADLETAARTAVTTRAQVVLGDRNLDVLAYVNDHPGGVTPKEVEEKLGYPDARRSLFRLADAGRIRKTGRGRYEPLPTPPGTTGTLEQSETDE